MLNNHEPTDADDNWGAGVAEAIRSAIRALQELEQGNWYNPRYSRWGSGNTPAQLFIGEWLPDDVWAIRDALPSPPDGGEWGPMLDGWAFECDYRAPRFTASFRDETAIEAASVRELVEGIKGASVNL